MCRIIVFTFYEPGFPSLVSHLSKNLWNCYHPPDTIPLLLRIKIFAKVQPLRHEGTKKWDINFILKIFRVFRVFRG